MYEPTIIATHHHRMSIAGVTFDLEIVDTAGQDEYSRIPSEASLGVHGYILVYDVTSRVSFEQLVVISDKLLESIGAEAVPRVLVANKADLKGPECVHGSRLIAIDDPPTVRLLTWGCMVVGCGRMQQVSDREGRDFASRIGCRLIETSARTRLNVDAVFEALLREIERESGLLDRSPYAAGAGALSSGSLGSSAGAGAAGGGRGGGCMVA